jgi:hypothetical protein
MGFVSTIPGAVATLEGYMQAVASATSVPDVKVFVGYSTPLSGMSDNFLMVGDYQEGTLVMPSDGDWASLPAAAKRRTETYALQGCMRAWAGGTDWQSRLDDIFSLLDGLQSKIVSDPGGGGTLSPSGSWGQFSWRMEANGPLINTAGWGVVLGFELHVVNVRITG